MISFLTSFLAAISMASTPQLETGDGMLFACFFKSDMSAETQKMRGFGIFVPEVKPALTLRPEYTSDPHGILNGASFTSMTGKTAVFSFLGAGKLKLSATGGSMYQADYKAVDGVELTGVCQGGPAGNRDNAIEFFEALAADFGPKA